MSVIRVIPCTPRARVTCDTRCSIRASGRVPATSPRAVPAACRDATAFHAPTRPVGGSSVRNTSRTQTHRFVAFAALSAEPPRPRTNQGVDDESDDTNALEGIVDAGFSKKHVPSGKSAVVLAGSLCAVATACYVLGTYTTVGAGVYEALSKSGFTAAFALIFVSELGDKTFFIAALLAMRLGRFTVLAGATSALCVMSVISVVIGRVFQKIPSSINDSLPLGEYLAVAMLFYFGGRTLMEALQTPESGKDSKPDSGEFVDAEEFVNASEEKKKLSPKKEKNFFGKFWETFTLVFIAEWGDRSMLATIALGAAQNPVGVTTGACFGHLVATLIAVVGGALLSQRISERQVGITGGVLFIGFAFATLAGVF